MTLARTVRAARHHAHMDLNLTGVITGGVHVRAVLVGGPRDGEASPTFHGQTVLEAIGRQLLPWVGQDPGGRYDLTDERVHRDGPNGFDSTMEYTWSRRVESRWRQRPAR